MRAAMRRTSAKRVVECWKHDRAAQSGDEWEYMYQTRSELQGQGTGFEEDNCFWFADGGASPLGSTFRIRSTLPSSPPPRDPHGVKLRYLPMSRLLQTFDTMPSE